MIRQLWKKLVGNHEHSLAQARRFHVEFKCEVNVGHLHYFDHWIEVKQGRIRILYRETPEGEDKVLGEFGPLDDRPFICKDIYHTVQALTDDVIYDCVSTHRDFNGQVSQRYYGNRQEAEARVTDAVVSHYSGS